MWRLDVGFKSEGVMIRVVKRSGSRIFWALGLLVCVALIIWGMYLTLEYDRLTKEYGFGDLLEIVHLELQEAGAQVLLAALITWRYADQLWAVVRLDRRRQAAARGEGLLVPRDLELRSLRPSILVPPATLRLRMAWKNKLLILIYLGTFLFIQLAIAFALANMQPLTSELVLIALGIDGSVLIFFALLFLLMFILSRERVEVTEEGLRVSRQGASHIVRWPEARLFAKVRKAEYELSSATSIVRWTRPLDASVSKPTIPMGDYQRQMDGLMLLIAERTGLRLYDVSDGKD
jgi:hypothetical protein